MMKGYDEAYLEDAMKNLGEAFDYAVNACGMTGDAFMALFLASGIADQFANGNPRYLVGQSGSELVLDVLAKVGAAIPAARARIEYDCSPEYWVGWFLAWYQWESGRSFRDIASRITIEDLLKMYPTLHEVSEERAADALNAVFARSSMPSRLQQQRKICGYSQKDLAERSGVNLRTLQQYELKTKDLKKASVSTVLSLANALGCQIDAILEASCLEDWPRIEIAGFAD